MLPNTAPRGIRSDVDLALERRGKMADLAVEDREAFARVADLLGCDIAAAHIRGDQHRRHLVRAAPDPAPRPGPAPKPTPPRPPLLQVLDGEGLDLDPEAALWEDVRRLVGRHRPGALSLPARLALDALRRLGRPPGA